VESCRDDELKDEEQERWKRLISAGRELGAMLSDCITFWALPSTHSASQIEREWAVEGNEVDEEVERGLESDDARSRWLGATQRHSLSPLDSYNAT
jgi:hypothetical protein